MDERSKRIAKNTLMLYIRTFFMMAISFWTSRLMLEALGIDNYGIKNVVGSIIGFSGLLTGAMGSAGSRFITYALGKEDPIEVRDVFCSSFHAQLIITCAVFIFFEIGGVWFLNYEANIPQGRMTAANIVLQTSVMSVIIGLMTIPYNSLIIAHEKMSVYAFINVIEASLQFGIVVLVYFAPFDKLILLSILQLLISIGMRTFYTVYSKSHFPEARLSFKFNWGRIKEICSFSGWNYIGNATWIFNSQGINMLVNIFFGVTINATRGITGFVNNTIQSFVNSFTTAFTPQITKSYAADDKSYCYLLVNRGTRIASMLQIIFIVPVFLEANNLLKLWLVDVPPMSVLFLRFVLVESFVLTLSGSLLKLLQANGKIKRLVLETSLFSALVFPLTWAAYKIGLPVWISYPIMIIIYSIILCFYIYESSRLTTYNWRTFITMVLQPIIIVILSSFIPLVILYLFMEENLTRFFIMVPVSVIWTLFNIYKWGLDKGERAYAVERILSIRSRLFGHYR